MIAAGADGTPPHTLVVDCEEIFYVDSTGAEALASLFEYAKRYGVGLKLAHVHSAMLHLLASTGVQEEIGEENLYSTVRAAVTQSG